MMGGGGLWCGLHDLWVAEAGALVVDVLPPSRALSDRTEDMAVLVDAAASWCD